MTAHLRVSRCYPTGRLTFCLPEAKSANRNLGDSFLLVSAMTLWIHNSQTCLFLGRSNCSHYLSEWTEGFYLNFQRWHADGLCGQTKGLYSANHKNVFSQCYKICVPSPTSPWKLRQLCSWLVDLSSCSGSINGPAVLFSAHFLVQQRIIIVCAYLFIGVDRGCRRRCRGSCSQINGSGIAAVQRKSRYGKCLYWLLYKKAVMVSL